MKFDSHQSNLKLIFDRSASKLLDCFDLITTADQITSKFIISVNLKYFMPWLQLLCLSNKPLNCLHELLYQWIIFVLELWCCYISSEVNAVVKSCIFPVVLIIFGGGMSAFDEEEIPSEWTKESQKNQLFFDTCN